MARLDHIAFRVKDRKKSAAFYITAFGYKVQQEFQIEFADGSKADCIALEPPEKQSNMSWVCACPGIYPATNMEYHLAPEIFISDGTPGSIVGNWVTARGGIGGVHHMAYMVDSVAETMAEWKEKGYAEFASDNPLTCPGLTQVFSRPSELTGIIYEFIQRGEHGFCVDNVKNLMESTKGF